MIYIGSDHRGLELKKVIKEYLEKDWHLPITDLGPIDFDHNDDYIDYAEKVAARVLEDPEKNRGILICGSGHGMDMTGNKCKGVRAALGFTIEVAKQSREHENTNVLVLASDWVKPEEGADIAKAWLDTAYSAAERHQRRLDHVARQPRVLADHDPVAVLAAREGASRRHADLHGDLRCHREGVGETADAVRAE